MALRITPVSYVLEEPEYLGLLRAERDLGMLICLMASDDTPEVKQHLDKLIEELRENHNG